MMKITINDKIYDIKYTLRSFFIYEKITNETFTGTKLLDYYILFYATLLANNSETFKITFDDFISICDNEPSLFSSFIVFLNKEMSIQNQFNIKNNETDTNKKKV